MRSQPRRRSKDSNPSSKTRTPTAAISGTPSIPSDSHAGDRSVSASNSRPVDRWRLGFVLLVFVATVLQNAWVSEDTYITFRTIDNWVHGHGLRWNAAERVQSYTHPLWLFLLAPLALVRANLFYGSIMISALVSLGAALVLTRAIARSAAAGALAVTVLIFSKSFVDYSTSGLENPLTHLLAVLFIATLLGGELNVGRYSLLSLWASLAVLNRMDTLLLFIPPLLWGLLKLRTVGHLVLGFLPFILWEVFSLVYYGFPFPNTAYAKLNTGIAPYDLLIRGLCYLQDCLTRDPLTAVVLVVGLVLPFLTRDGKRMMIALGVLLYLAYVVRNGGCFMAGRFLTTPLLCGVAMIVSAQWARSRSIALAATGFVALAGLLSPYPPLFTGPGYGSKKTEWIEEETGIADERGFYFGACSLINALQHAEMPAHPWAQAGRELRGSGKTVAVVENIGLVGYYAGPGVHIVDPLALSDPLLARLPALIRKGDWRTGHFLRTVPDGYVESLRTGKNLISDKALAEYYDHLRLVVSGPILSGERLAAIWRLNVGTYDRLLRSYVDAPITRIPLSSVTAPILSRTQPPQKTFSHNGLQIDLPRLSHDQIIKAVLNDQNVYQIVVCRGNTAVVNWQVGPHKRARNALAPWLAAVPPARAKAGYDNIRIYPFEGDGHYALARLVVCASYTPEAAMESCREDLELRPDDAQSHVRMGSLLRSLGRSAEALPYLREAVRLEPDYADAQTNLAVALGAVGRYGEALPHHLEALRLNANDADTLTAFAWLRATCPNEALRNGAEAVKMAEQACRLTENRNPDMLDTLAAAYAEAGRFKEAAETANKAIALFRQAGQEAPAQATAGRLQLYLRGQAFRVSASTPTQPSSAATRSS